MSQARIHRAYQAVFVLGFLLLALFSYGRSLDAPLLFDSTTSLSDNPLVQITGSQYDDWRSAAGSFGGSILGRPLAMLSFAANYVVGDGFFAPQLRAVNVFLHFLGALLLYLTLVTVLSKAVTLSVSSAKIKAIAGFTSLIWLLHPINVSTVLYVVQRMTQLSALFVLLGLWVFSFYRGNWCHKSPNLGEFLALSIWLLLITSLAVLCKENGLLLLWLLPVLEVSFFRGRWGGAENRLLKWLAWSALLLPVLLVLALIATDSMPFLGSYQQRSFTLSERLLTQLRVLWHYFYWLILPNLQAMALHHDDIILSKNLFQPVTTILALIAWVTAISAAFIARKRYPILMFCVLFYLVAHSLESSVLPLELAWEHRNYLPGMAVALLMSWLGAELMSRSSVGQRWAAAGGVLCLMAALLFLRADRWSDELTLSQATVLNHPQSIRANYHYANTLYRTYENDNSSAENKELLPLARHFYELMYQLDNDDIAALVSLYFLDERYFPMLREKVDWFTKLETAASHRVFTLADFNALKLLSACVDGGGCSPDAQRMLAFYHNLSLRYPSNVQVWLLISRYHSQVLNDDLAALEAIDQALAIAPTSRAAYQELLLIRDKNGDVGGVMVTIANILKYDTRRLRLQQVKQMLGLDLSQ
ncbi:MAG: hypothetical protein ACJAZ0_000847 [Halioglobus sp.]